MRIVFIGCVQFSQRVLEYLLALNIPGVRIAGVVTKQASAFNADFASLTPLAQAHNLPCFIAEGADQGPMQAWLKGINADVIYCVGWSSLLGDGILSLPRLGVIGYHPAALPRNRGRHPVIWALALGLKETGSTFFVMNQRADAGAIVDQRLVAIEAQDDAATLYAKLEQQACQQIAGLTGQFMRGEVKPLVQDEAQANHWRKRTKADGQIDWRMSAQGIHNLIRALTRPYPGAHFVYGPQEFKVFKSTVIEAMAADNIEPGKILDVNGSTLTVKCGQGALQLVEHQCTLGLKRGDYLLTV